MAFYYIAYVSLPTLTTFFEFNYDVIRIKACFANWTSALLLQTLFYNRFSTKLTV